jgi:two-component sensor histidine kinase
LETSLKSANNETEFFEGAYVPKLDATGKTDGLIGYFRNITERKRAEAKLQASLREKEALLKEIHHRVKNNLQVVTSLLRLQSGKMASPEVQAALLDLQNRVHAMALIHEHLYRAENLAQVDLAPYLKILCAQLFHALVARRGAVQFHQDLASVHLGLDQAIPCGLLVNELVSNCLKHAFPDGRAGEVRVELQPVAGGPAVRLRVADNGVGLPAGFDLKRLTSLGLQLAPDLARQMGGKLEIGPGPGAVFEVTFTPESDPVPTRPGPHKESL